MNKVVKPQKDQSTLHQLDSFKVRHISLRQSLHWRTLKTYWQRQIHSIDRPPSARSDMWGSTLKHPMHSFLGYV